MAQHLPSRVTAQLRWALGVAVAGGLAFGLGRMVPFGPPSTPPPPTVRLAALAALDADPSELARAAALRQLSHAARPEDLPRLRTLAQDPSRAVAAAALRTLARLPSGIDVLLEFADGAHARSARLALGSSEDPRALEALLALVHTPDSTGVEEALARNGSPEAVDALIERHNLTGGLSRAPQALASIAADVPEARQALIEACQRPLSGHCYLSLSALVAVSDPAVSDILLRILAHPDYRLPGFAKLDEQTARQLLRARPEDRRLYGLLWRVQGPDMTAQLAKVLQAGSEEDVRALLSGLEGFPESERLDLLLGAAGRSRVAPVLRHAVFRLRPSTVPSSVVQLARSEVEREPLDPDVACFLSRYGDDADRRRVRARVAESAIPARAAVAEAVRGRGLFDRAEMGLLEDGLRDPTHYVGTIAAQNLPEGITGTQGRAVLDLYARAPTVYVAGVLGRWQDQEAIDALVVRAVEGDTPPAQAAVTALARSPHLGHREALQQVLEQLHSTQNRRVAMRELLSRDVAMVDRALGDPDPMIRQLAVEKLALQFDETSRSRLLSLVGDPDLEEALLDAAPSIGGPEALALVRAALDDPNRVPQAYQAMAQLDIPEARRELREAAGGGPHRAEALYALGTVPSRGDLETFADGVHAEQREVAAASLIGLEGIGGTEAAELLAEQLDGELGVQAAAALSRMGGAVYVRERDRIEALQGSP